MINRIYLTSLIFCFFHLMTEAQESDSNILVSNDKKWAFVEPHLASSDKYLVAASMAFTKGKEGAFIKVYYSEDEGKNWQPSELNNKDISGDDPWLASDNEGNFYLSFLPNILYKSENGGKSWVKLKSWPLSSHDYPKLAIDKTGSKHTDNLYVWSSYYRKSPSNNKVYPVGLFSMSDDQTEWSSMELLPNNINNQVGDLTILPSGEILMSFHEIDLFGKYLKFPRLWVVRSDDGGKTFTPPFLVHEYFVSDSPDLAVDVSDGTFSGRVYLTFMGALNQNDLDNRAFGHYLMSSNDKGVTWSEPLLLSDSMKVTYAPHHPMVCVNSDGVIGTSFKSPANPDPNRCTSLKFSFSKDGGQSFSPSIDIAKPSCSNVMGNEIPVSNGERVVYDRFRDGGDYHGLTSLKNGSFGIVWTDSSEGIFQVFFRRVKFDEIQKD